MDKMLKIAVAGTGYVGLSIATLLAQHHEVCAIDVIPAKVDLINRRKSPIRDEYIEKYLAEKELKLTATLDPAQAYSGADFVVIAAPTNYDSRTQHFDTSAVEAVIQLVMQYNPNAVMVIKSTIPVGYTVSVRERLGSRNILFSPEFLRESKALYDNLYPSRIIVGTDPEDAHLVAAAHEFAALLQEGAIKEDIDTLFMGFTEAEAVKLFANTYLHRINQNTTIFTEILVQISRDHRHIFQIRGIIPSTHHDHQSIILLYITGYDQKIIPIIEFIKFHLYMMLCLYILQYIQHGSIGIKHDLAA